MRIGYDAKRAFTNFTGLGNYSRDTIRILSSFFNKNDYVLYTPTNKVNDRLDFLKNQSNVSIKSPHKLLDKIFSSYWRTKNILNDIKKDNIDIYHGLSHELPIGIENTKIKTIVTIHDLIYLRYPNLFSSIDLSFIFFNRTLKSLGLSNCLNFLQNFTSISLLKSILSI